MGLDVTSYSKLKHVGKHAKDPELNEGEPGGVDDCCYYENHVDAFAYDAFPQSFRGIPIIGRSKGFIEGGCYATTDETKTHGFGRTYGGYNRWRDNLRRQFNPDQEPEKPFYELIYFADNEGSIGPEAAADLLVDFQEHRAAYVPMEGELNGYENWMRACELAADSGLIHFG